MAYEIRIVDYRDIPASVAKKFVDAEYEKYIGGRAVEGVGETEREPIPEERRELLKRLKEYLDRVVKCDAENAEKLYQELLNLGLMEISAAMIVDIRPISIGELRTLLHFETRMPDEEVLRKILELLDQYCPAK